MSIVLDRKRRCTNFGANRQESDYGFFVSPSPTRSLPGWASSARPRRSSVKGRTREAAFDGPRPQTKRPLLPAPYELPMCRPSRTFTVEIFPVKLNQPSPARSRPWCHNSRGAQTRPEAYIFSTCTRRGSRSSYCVLAWHGVVDPYFERPPQTAKSAASKKSAFCGT